MPNAGDPILVEDFPPSVSNDQNTSGTTGSTSYTATLTGGTACAVTFVAPTSGVVLIMNVCQIDNDGANQTFAGFRVGTGSTAGAGTEVLAASDLRAIRHEGTNYVRSTSVYRLTGLTAGDTYNVQQQYRVSGGTGTFSNKSLIVAPQPA